MAVALVIAAALLSVARPDTTRAEGPAGAFVAAAEYAYPIDNAWLATMVGTPNEFKAGPQSDLPLEPGLAVVRPDKEIPNLFWYLDGLPYAIAAQPEPAPLMFVIGGFGSGPLTEKMISLADTYFAAGYHVVLLPSPSYPAFIAAASEHSVPGRIATDVADLVHAMRAIEAEIAPLIEITGRSVSGFSLGGIHSLFIAEYADRTPDYTIDLAIALNPPVNLLNTSIKLDALLEERLPGGMNNLQAFYDEVFGDVAAFYSTTERVDFSDDFLYRLAVDREFDDDYMASLIGLSFRMSLANMLFTSDVVTDSGFIKPAGHELSPADPLTLYFQATARFSMEEYARDYLHPYYAGVSPEISFEALAAEASLRSIEEFLLASDNTFLVHNVDDIILVPGDIEYLASVFGERALIFPRGGHLGNLTERTYVEHLISLAKENGQ